MRVSDGTHAGHFDRWGLEGETIELAVVRGAIAGRTRYLALVTLDFVARYLENGDDDGAAPPLDGRYVRRLVTRLHSDGMIGALAVTFSPSGVYIPAGDDDQQLGVLRLARTTRMLIWDGRHRQAAIRRALAEDPRLAEETIALELFAHDGSPRRSRRTASPAAEDPSGEAARLAALNMALNGHSRDEVDEYLVAQFNLRADDALLDQVFATDTRSHK